MVICLGRNTSMNTQVLNNMVESSLKYVMCTTLKCKQNQRVTCLASFHKIFVVVKNSEDVGKQN